MKYRVQLSATVRTYRIVTVEADDAEAATRRARRLVKAADAGKEIETDEEDVGDWCDSDSPTRVRVEGVIVETGKQG